MLDEVRRVRRSLRVARTGLGVYLGYKWVQRRARRLPGAAAEDLWRERHDRAAATVYRLCVDLRGLYVKTGQFVGTRSDLVPGPYVRRLSRLQDSMPPRPLDQVTATIERELGRPLGNLFAWFGAEPLAAASLAQVHRARLHDGREVAVKVQYPEVAGLVRLDIRNLRTIARVVARLEPAFDYRAVVEELARQVPRELDFVREAEMTRRLRANLAGNPCVVVPEVVDEFVTRRVLVTTYLDGTRLFDHGGTLPAGAEAATIARTLADAFGQQILLDGLFQADPHPGNILLLKDGRLAIVDFGLTKELPRNIRTGFARLIEAGGRRDPAGVLAAFREMGVKTKGDSPQEALDLTRIFMEEPEPGLGGGPSRVEALRRSPIEALPTDLVLVARAVGLLRGVCTSLGVPLTPMEMLAPYAAKALDQLEGAARART